MRNPLQDQLLKAGLVNKSKAAQAVREQVARHKGKQPAAPSAEQLEVERLQAEKAERARVPRIECEHVAIAGFRLAQMAGLMMRQRLPEQRVFQRIGGTPRRPAGPVFGAALFPVHDLKT